MNKKFTKHIYLSIPHLQSPTDFTHIFITLPDLFFQNSFQSICRSVTCDIGPCFEQFNFQTRCLERFFFSCAARKSTILNITTRGHMKWYFTNLDRRISFPTAALPEWGTSHPESLIPRSAIGPKRATTPLISCLKTVSRDHPGCTIYNYTLYILYTSSLLYKMSNLEN